MENLLSKNCPEYAPDFVGTHEEEGINYIVCNELKTLLWLGNQLAFEFHIPFQTISSKGPSEIVFDLDPPSKDAFPLAIKAANLIKEVLDHLELISFIKTSGNKGLQVYIPLPDNRYSYDDTRLFTSFVADYLVSKDPDSFTTERMKKSAEIGCMWTIYSTRKAKRSLRHIHLVEIQKPLLPHRFFGKK